MKGEIVLLSPEIKDKDKNEIPPEVEVRAGEGSVTRRMIMLADGPLDAKTRRRRHRRLDSLKQVPFSLENKVHRSQEPVAVVSLVLFPPSG